MVAMIKKNSFRARRTRDEDEALSTLLFLSICCSLLMPWVEPPTMFVWVGLALLWFGLLIGLRTYSHGRPIFTVGAVLFAGPFLIEWFPLLVEHFNSEKKDKKQDEARYGVVERIRTSIQEVMDDAYLMIKYHFYAFLIIFFPLLTDKKVTSVFYIVEEKLMNWLAKYFKYFEVEETVDEGEQASDSEDDMDSKYSGNGNDSSEQEERLNWEHVDCE